MGVTKERPEVDNSALDEVESESDIVTEENLIEEYREYLEGRAPEKNHAKDALAEALRQLRQHGPMETSELQEAVYEADERFRDAYNSPRSLWNSIGRYVDEETPGFEKPDYGKWGYAGDDEVRAVVRNN